MNTKVDTQTSIECFNRVSMRVIGLEWENEERKGKVTKSKNNDRIPNLATLTQKLDIHFIPTTTTDITRGKDIN